MDILGKAFQGVESSIFLKILGFIFPAIAPAIILLGSSGWVDSAILVITAMLIAYLLMDGVVNLFTTSYRSHYFWLPLAFGALILGYFSFAYYASYYYTKITHDLDYGLITYHFHIMIVGIIVFSALYMILYFILDRGTLTSQTLVRLFGKSEKLERTDVRKLKSFKHRPYDPIKYFKDKQYFLGMNRREKPIYILNDDYRSRHIQVIGKTGSGKGVATMQLLYQGVAKGDGIYVIDPKGDKYAPHVLKQACDRYGVPFQYFDLSKDIPQLNIFAGLTQKQIVQALIAGLGLANKGEAADFYRTEDREATRLFVEGIKSCKLDNPSFSDLFHAYQQIMDPDKAKGFLEKLKEIDTIECLKTREGHLNLTIEKGGVTYIRGSVGDTTIVCIQKMLTFIITEMCKRNRDQKQRHITLFLDELKHCLSKAVTDAFGTIRDFDANVIVAHQSLEDLEDVDGDLSPKAVSGAVLENTDIKYMHQTRAPKTLKWIEEMSGTVPITEKRKTFSKGSQGNSSSYTHTESEQTIEVPRFHRNTVLGLQPQTCILASLGSDMTIVHSQTFDVVPGEMQPREAKRADMSGSDISEEEGGLI